MHQQTLISPNVFTLDEVASYLRLSKEIVEQLALNGKIPCRKIEDSWRFLRTAIDDWLKGEDSKGSALTEDKTLFQAQKESSIISNVRQLSPLDKIRLLRILVEELDIKKSISPFELYKVYDLPTPYNTFGAGKSLMDAMALNNSDQTK